MKDQWEIAKAYNAGKSYGFSRAVMQKRGGRGYPKGAYKDGGKGNVLYVKGKSQNMMNNNNGGNMAMSQQYGGRGQPLSNQQ